MSRSRSIRRRGLTASARGRGPVRTCIGCRRVTTVEELVRIRRTRDGIEPGPGPGRGAWLCRAHPRECLDEAQRRRAVARSLRSPIEDDEIRRLRAKLMPEQ